MRKRRLAGYVDADTVATTGDVGAVDGGQGDSQGNATGECRNAG